MRREEVPTSDLIFDEQNPRLRNAGASQRDAMLRIAVAQGPKLIGLAAHIAKHGLNPAEAFLVVPQGKKYRVLDGNRRLSAIRALDTPAAFSTALPKSRIARLADLNATAQIPPTAWCAIFRDEAEAEPFVSLRHLGSGGGAGLEKWSGEQKRRHEERIGRAKAPDLQVLDFVRDAGTLTAEAQKLAESGNFPLTLIQRLVEGPAAREAAGLGPVDTDGNLTRLHPAEEVLKPLTKFVQDIADKQITSRSLNKAADVAKYFKELDPVVRPDPRTKASDAVPLGSGQAAATAGAKKVGRKRDRKSTADRPYLIPSTTDLEITTGRVHNIYLELKKKVLVDEAPNATGALLRTFLEMTLSLYIKRHSLPKGKDLEYWRPNWNAARQHLDQAATLDKKALDKIEHSIFDPSTGFTTVNAVVHDPDYDLTGKELKALWSRLEPLFLAIWPR